ncbi:hypothetical protein EC988_004536, partial [Linderina pennispora]
MQLPPVDSFRILETTLYTREKGFWLLDKHVARLKRSADLLRLHYPAECFPTEQVTADAVVQAATAAMAAGGDERYRIRMLLDHTGSLQVQATVEPQQSGSTQAPPVLVLDSEPTLDTDSVFVKCKTTHRQIYERAQDRIPKSYPAGTQVLLFNQDGLVTEGNIANVAVGVPVNGELRLVTPCVDAGLLAGTARSQFIESGDIVEGQ